jgi:thermostable 8-oxoguanine DNA glycosylase
MPTTEYRRKNSQKLKKLAAKKLGEFARKLGMSQAELDLYMWFLKTNKVLK